MASLAVGADARKAVAGGLDRDVVGGGQRGGVGAHDGAGEAGDGVGHGAAVELDELAARDGVDRAELALIDALLAANQREVGVRREAEQRLGAVLEVVLDVAHGRLLGVADDATQGVGELLARGLDHAGKEVRGVEREDEGALVVEDAAADEVAVLARDVEGGEGPAEAERDDVGVGNGGDVAVGLAGEVGVADVAVEVGDGKAEAGGDLFGGNQRLVGCRAPGLAGLRVLQVLDRLDLHKGADILDDILPDLVDKDVDVLLELLLVHASSLCSAHGASVGGFRNHLSAWRGGRGRCLQDGTDSKEGRWAVRACGWGRRERCGGSASCGCRACGCSRGRRRRTRRWRLARGRRGFRSRSGSGRRR